MARTFFVTGADGFIGSNFCELLVNTGYKVKALVQYNSLGSNGWLDDSDVRHEIDIFHGDIRDADSYKKALENVDCVVNFAALIAIPYSYQASKSYLDVNVMGTHTLASAVLASDRARLVQISTSEVYGTAKYIPIDESHPLQPQSPYSASKIASDAVAMSFHNSFDLPVTLARPFNTFGPRQSSRAIIPTVITQTLAHPNAPLKLGDLSPTRDYTFVEDTCRGVFECATSADTVGQTLNIGSNCEISMLDLVKLIRAEAGFDNFEIVEDEQRVRPQKSEVYRLWCDNSKLKSITGFQPRISLRDGLKATIDWHKRAKNLNRYRPDRYAI